MRQDLQVGAHAAHALGGQAHRMLRLQVCAVRHGSQVQELAALAHVAPAPGHQHQGPARAADAVQLRPGTSVQPAPQGRRQGTCAERRSSRGFYGGRGESVRFEIETNEKENRRHKTR